MGWLTSLHCLYIVIKLGAVAAALIFLGIQKQTEIDSRYKWVPNSRQFRSLRSDLSAHVFVSSALAMLFVSLAGTLRKRTWILSMNLECRYFSERTSFVSSILFSLCYTFFCFDVVPFLFISSALLPLIFDFSNAFLRLPLLTSASSSLGSSDSPCIAALSSLFFLPLLLFFLVFPVIFSFSRLVGSKSLAGALECVCGEWQFGFPLSCSYLRFRIVVFGWDDFCCAAVLAKRWW